ncbi:MAG: hypothetical protein GF364_20525 [Candidatus Lokiarchaeota archaeon]|nr:hypothetical protein [Candidatus Lokiarchaeota archaeon]
MINHLYHNLLSDSSFNKLNPLIIGSFAIQYYTGFYREVNDIDLVCKQNAIQQIQDIILNHNFRLNENFPLNKFCMEYQSSDDSALIHLVADKLSILNENYTKEQFAYDFCVYFNDCENFKKEFIIDNHQYQILIPKIEDLIVMKFLPILYSNSVDKQFSKKHIQDLEILINKCSEIDEEYYKERIRSERNIIKRIKMNYEHYNDTIRKFLEKHNIC